MEQDNFDVCEFLAWSEQIKHQPQRGLSVRTVRWAGLGQRFFATDIILAFSPLQLDSEHYSSNNQNKILAAMVHKDIIHFATAADKSHYIMKMFSVI